MQNTPANTPMGPDAPRNVGKTHARTGGMPNWLFATLLVLPLLGVAYLYYDAQQMREMQAATQKELAAVNDQVASLLDRSKVVEDHLQDLSEGIMATRQDLGTANQEFKKSTQRMRQEVLRSTSELNNAIAAKADALQVEALKKEAETKIGEVSTEVGGVKSDVGAVKGDLATTRQDLEGTQRQLVDVKETLSAAVAKNSTELASLRRKGERDYVEFTISRKGVPTQIQDIRVVLTKTDAKKSKFNLRILADDSSLEKKDRTINEPIQFLIGSNRLRYELVVNWVQKDRAGGYLSIPKDRILSAEGLSPKE